MRANRIGNSELYVKPLAFGGNVFGWTADESMSYRLLDSFVDAGFNLIDTADVYTRWIDGHIGGESETIIGKWIKRSKKRQQVVIATKVGFDMDPSSAGRQTDKRSLKKTYILKAVEDSLRRLQVDVIDLYQTHIDDPDTPVNETMEALDLLVRQGKVRAVGASQVHPDRLRESQEYAKANHLTPYVCLQPEYNLCERQNYDRNLKPIVEEYNLGVITYFSLAGGFLTGKYRSESDLEKSVRGRGIVKAKYFNDRGLNIVRALDKVSHDLNAPMSAVALAWICSNHTISAPIASATNLEQLKDILCVRDLILDSSSLSILNHATAT